MNIQIPPTTGTKAINTHQPDLLRSCQRFTWMARPIQTMAIKIARDSTMLTALPPPNDGAPLASIVIELPKIAEARVAYGGRGQITDVQQPRYGQQFFDIIWPF